MSKLTTMALSRLALTVVFRNSLAASCSNLKRSRMLLLVSTRTASRSGRSLSELKSWITCGFLPSMISKSSFVRSVTKRPFLSRTVKSMSTRVTSTVMRDGSSCSTGTGLAGWAGICSAAQTAMLSAPMATRGAQAFIWPDYTVVLYSTRSQWRGL